MLITHPAKWLNKIIEQMVKASQTDPRALAINYVIYHLTVSF